MVPRARFPTRRPRGAARAVARAAAFGAIAVAALAAPRPSRAQEARDAVRLDSLVVTATRLPVPRGAVASAVTVVTGDELRTRGITNLLDALRAVPGATAAQGGSFGTPASLFVRGGESDYVKVLIDGVAVNEPGGAFDFAHLATDNIERIEVVRGPASVLYGSDAVAGVVQVFTRSGRGAPRWRLDAGGGTYGTSRVEAEAAGGSARAGFSVSVSRFESDGTGPFNSAYRRNDASALLRATAGAGSDLRLTIRLDDHVTHFPTDYAGRPTDRNQYTTGSQATFGLEGRQILSSRLELRFQLASNATGSGFDNRPDGPADTLGYFRDISGGHATRRSADLRAVAYLGAGTTLTVGGTVERQSDRSRDSASTQWGPSLDSLAESRRNGAAYVQLVADPSGRVALNAGARLDRNARFGSFGTYRAGLAWRLAPSARLRAAVGSALKEPTFYENYATGFVVGNPALLPERSRSLEVGGDVQLTSGGPSFSVTWFDQRFTDLIQYTATTAAPGLPNYFNIAAAAARGLEAEGTQRLGGALTVRLRYAYLRTAVRDAGFETAPDGAFAEGRPLLRRPAHAGGASLEWAVGAAACSVEAGVVGRRDDMDYAGAVPARVTLPAYARVDASVTLPLLGRGRPGGLMVTLRADNLLDARYEEVRGFPARGRAFLVGLRADGGFR